jgi:Tol biopolymer transport system component
LTAQSGFCGDPHWSPDGERIVFASYQEDQWGIYVVPAKGGKPKRLINTSGTVRAPSWSQDGRWIYFASHSSGEYQVWKVAAGGGEAIQVTRKGGFAALESPDGQWVYYTKNDGVSALWKLPRDGGEEVKVIESLVSMAFAVANRGIYFMPLEDSTGHRSIQFFDLATNKIRSICSIERPIEVFLSVSPDERWILYSQIDQMGSDLMLVENFR